MGAYLIGSRITLCMEARAYWPRESSAWAPILNAGLRGVAIIALAAIALSMDATLAEICLLLIQLAVP